MTREALNGKAWYRALKVIYVLAVIIPMLLMALVGSIVMVSEWPKQKRPTQASIEAIGIQLKMEFPNDISFEGKRYTDYSDSELGLRLYNKYKNLDFKDSAADTVLDFFARNGGLLRYDYVVGLPMRILAAIIQFIGSLGFIFMIHVLIKKTFFYVLLGEGYFVKSHKKNYG